MHVDTLTLMIPGSFAAALASIFLFGAWVQTRTALSLLWWAVGSLAASLGVALLIAGLATGQSLGIATGVGISTVAPALFWGGIRQFNRRRVPVFALLAGIVAWGAAGPLAQLFGHEPGTWSTLVSFSTWCIYLPASAWELTRARREKLNALWPMIGVLILHSLVYLGGSHDLITGELVLGNPPRLFSWFGAIHFESIIFAMASATLMILLNKERVERTYIEAARIDPLTGVANRRALIEGSTRLFSRLGDKTSALSVAMFDLDHFKAINDTLGHEVGDRVLQGFAATVRNMLRPTDLFGRYGGEEFLLVMPNVSIEAAWAIADRIRGQFALDFKFIDGRPLTATVSVGVAMATPGATLDQVIAAADTAMYLAKSGGRNRVARSETQASEGDGKIVRLA